MNIEKLKKEFIEDQLKKEILTLTLQGGFQVRRGKRIYKKYPIVPEERRKKFRIDIKQQLIEISKSYKSRKIDETEHIENIKKFITYIQDQNKDILYEEIFRFGIGQKLLNLYLKYLWTLGLMKEEPPHCPIDGQISRILKSGYKFAISNDIEEYKKVIEKAKKRSSEEGFFSLERKFSPAQWELKEWNEWRKQMKNELFKKN